MSDSKAGQVRETIREKLNLYIRKREAAEANLERIRADIVVLERTLMLLDKEPDNQPKGVPLP